MSDNQARTSRRGAAKQERSLITVDALLRATELLLARSGYEALSTTAIAEQAGVSVGSLYQYFSNRDALVATLVERRYDRLEAVVAQSLEQPSDGASPRKTLSRFIDTLVAAYLFEPAVNRALLQCAAQVGLGDRAEAFEQRLTRALVAVAARARTSDPPSQHGAAGFVLAKAVLSSLDAALKSDSPLLRDGTLRRELRTLVEQWTDASLAPSELGTADDQLRDTCLRHLAPVLGPALAARAFDSVASTEDLDREAALGALAPVVEAFLGVSHTRLVLGAIRKELSP